MTSTQSHRALTEHDAQIHASLVQLGQLERQQRILAAQQSRVLAEAYLAVISATATAHAKHRELALRSLAAECGLVVDRPCRTMTTRMERATSLLESFPATQRCWEAGEIDGVRAELIERHGKAIERTELRQQYERAALEAAIDCTPGELERIVRRLSEQAREQHLDERFEEAQALRTVAVEPLKDGLAALSIVMQEWQAHAIFERVTEIAKDNLRAEAQGRTATVSGQGDSGATRTLDQVRADVVAELLLQSDPTANVLRPDGGALRYDARVSVTVPALSLLGRSREAAVLSGVGPIPLSLAKQLAAEQPSFERILTDPITSQPLAVDRYRPSEAMRRMLAVRDECCRFPGCSRRAERCDLDHTHDAAKGGQTTVRNLAHLCRWHHTLKHWRGWQVSQDSAGVLHWISPNGITRATRPPSAHARIQATDATEPCPSADPRSQSGGTANHAAGAVNQVTGSANAHTRPIRHSSRPSPGSRVPQFSPKRDNEVAPVFGRRASPWDLTPPPF